VNNTFHIVVMGVAGSGKSTVASLIAQHLKRPMAEGDDFHNSKNIAKMSAGIALTDDNRAHWLSCIREWLNHQTEQNQPAVITCSALRRQYRDFLQDGSGQVQFVHLAGSPDLIRQRLQDRRNHFMPASLIPSQFIALEELEPDELGTTLPIDNLPAEIAYACLNKLGLVKSDDPKPWESSIE